jgi:hypothetical protein
MRKEARLSKPRFQDLHQKCYLRVYDILTPPAYCTRKRPSAPSIRPSCDLRVQLLTVLEKGCVIEYSVHTPFITVALDIPQQICLLTVLSAVEANGLVTQTQICRDLFFLVMRLPIGKMNSMRGCLTSNISHAHDDGDANDVSEVVACSSSESHADRLG